MHSEVAIFNVVICNIMELNILGNSITSNGFANLNLTLTMVVCKEKKIFFFVVVPQRNCLNNRSRNFAVAKTPF